MATVKYSGPVASFHCPTEATIRSLKVHFSPKQLGSGTPSPENIRPIEGWEGVTVHNDIEYIPIPAEYQRVEYIYNTDTTEWIDTGIIPYTNTKAQIKVSNLNWTGDVILGYYAGNDKTDWRIFNYNQTLYFDAPNLNNNLGRRWIGSGQNWQENGIYEFEIGNFYAKNLITNTDIFRQEAQEFEGTNNITLNSYGQANSIKCSKNRWYYVKLYDGDTLVRNMYPCRRKSDNKPGMYDTVSGEFFTNQGTGDFICGPDVGETMEYEFGVLGKNKLSDNLTDYILINAPADINFSNGSFSGTVNEGQRDVAICKLNKKYPAGTYTLSFDYVNNVGNAYWRPVLISKYNDSGWYSALISTNTASESSGHYVKTFTTTEDFYIHLTLNCFDSASTTAINSISNLQLELGSTATAYEPYDPNKTVYGGYIDLVEGKIVQEYSKLVCDGSIGGFTYTNITSSGNYSRFSKDITELGGLPAAGMKEQFNSKANYMAVLSISDWFININNANRLLCFVPTTIDSSEAWIAYLMEHPLEIVYKLATPIEYPIPSTQLTTFCSQNNIWSNADYVEVEYDLHETQNILARKQFIIANQPHIVKPAAAPLQNFVTDVAAPLKECKVYFNPIQEGSGDASLENVRPINGWNSIQIGLPSEYQKVEYLESSGTQNINLGKALNVDDYCFYFKLMPLTLGYDSASGNYAGIMGQNAAPQVGWYQGGWTVGNRGSASPFLPEIGQIYELEYSKDFYGNYCVNGQETGLRRRGNMLCRLFYVESKSNNAIARLYSAYAIDKSNKYVYNLIPCVRKSDSKPGMYDSISKTFYTNSGTGEFICGPNIEEQSLLIDWTDSTGTIYGGYLDLVKGEIVEEWHKIVADGVNVKANRGNYKSDVLQSYGGAIVYLNPIGEGSESNAFCDNLLLNSNTTIPTIHTYARGQMYAIFYLFPYSDYEEEPTATDIMNATNEWLQEHPTTIVYKLRNPIHHLLTPQTLKSLRGTNNIWASNNGDNIELSYWKH